MTPSSGRISTNGEGQMWRQAGIGERVPLVLGGCAAVLLTVTAATAEPNAIVVLSSLHNLEYAEAACSHLRSIADIKDIIEPQWVIGTAEEIAKTQRRSDWRRLSAGAGTKGPRLHDWCYLELADLEGEESNHHSQVLWTRGLLIRRNIANGDLAYFTTWCPAGTSIETLVSVEGHRWAIEDSFETAKNEFGLDHNESRSWHGWHRHVSLVMLAFAMMAAIQHQANKPAPKKTKSSATPRHPTSSVGRSRKSAA